MQPSTPSREHAGAGTSGFPALALLLASILLGLFGAIVAADDPTVLLALPLVTILGIFLILGFYKLQPNEAGVLTLFGAYRGTDRGTGLRWTWPWIARKKVSCRAHNLISQQIKVNDLRGNPIEIAAQLVWRITDTAQATFDVDNYAEFVLAQVEVAVRTIGARYPYDDFEHKEVTLRGDHEQIAGELRTELIERLKVAGITVDECGFTHLAYAPEIAGSMLRRQQAAAVVAARETLVLGAVSMVEMALEQLSARDIIQLDGERRAAMVSNLMVILCGDREAQPVVNTGSLYQ
ncbi:membrane protein [Polymorphobacter multimanifer]|uniref:Regulator of protease activity HflC (Stomatin/prohibitin superfamily) n=1 Tax=Polymorphobacter multimanifer TaxID=1070431 RepID=A0A841L655_9SPHN|nr:SPFH domain-containing protein [Polymorphobacter multimanifer]MBB6227726.1 regulator of protease activity HflC (stomatin/prohibitin superfamily) [Polymorphobacter multimanifer]GGI91061.1 membrane protein [Polymorphobacter multimanifer]